MAEAARTREDELGVVLDQADDKALEWGIRALNERANELDEGALEPNPDAARMRRAAKRLARILKCAQ